MGANSKSAWVGLNSDRNSPASGAAVAVPVAQPGSPETLPVIAKAIYIGGTGDVTVVTELNETVTFLAVAAGTILPIVIKQIVNTTTATNMVIMY